MTKTSASSSRASSALVRSLSTTASTPISWRSVRRVVHRRNAATAGADDDHPLLHEQPDRPDLEDPGRQRRRDDAPPGVAVRLEDPALLGGQPIGGSLVVDRADELGRVGERRVVGVDLDHRQDRRERHLERQPVAQLLLEHVADHALGRGPEDVERVGLLFLVGGGLQGEEPDLRAVAVGHDERVPSRRRWRGAPPRRATFSRC